MEKWEKIIIAIWLVANGLLLINSILEAPPENPILIATKTEIDKLLPGQILFNPPQEMTVGEKERVEVLITKDFTKNLSEGLRGRGIPQIERISIGTFMKVHLIGDNLYIESLSPENQPVLNERVTQWDFDVTPLKTGNQILRLNATVRIKIPNEPEETLDVVVFERQIDVKINPIEDELNKLTLKQNVFNLSQEIKFDVAEREQIVFNTSQEMKVDVAEKVEIRIPKNIIDNSSKKHGEMIVNLTGKNFDIEQGHIVPGEDFTERTYYVTPLRSGDQSLKLNIGIILTFPNGEKDKYEKAFDKTIIVKSNTIGSVEKFIKDNWKEIIGLIISSGIFAWIRKKWGYSIFTWIRKKWNKLKEMIFTRCIAPSLG